MCVAIMWLRMYMYLWYVVYVFIIALKKIKWYVSLCNIVIILYTSLYYVATYVFMFGTYVCSYVCTMYQEFIICVYSMESVQYSICSV